MTKLLSPHVRLGMLLAGVARRWRAILDDGLSEVGLSDATWRPLIYLARADGPLTQKELAARVGLDASSLVRLVDILASKDLVTRRRDPLDRRSNLLSLTPAGEILVGRIQKALDAVETRLLDDFEGEEVATLVSLLDRLDDRIRAIRYPEDRVR